MSKKVKCRLFKLEKEDDYTCYECGHGDNSNLLVAGVDWWELDQKEYCELRAAVQKANRRLIGRTGYTSTKSRDTHYILVIAPNNYEEAKEKVFLAADEFIKSEKACEERAKKREAEAKKKKEKDAKERKRKQLEKLKKELGEG